MNKWVQGARAGNRWSMRLGLIGCLLVSLLCHGCGTAIRLGRLPDVTPLESKLEHGHSTRDDVLAALGEPRGRGRVCFPVHDEPRDVWYYYYEEATLKDSQRFFLYVFFDGDRYDGYLWFSSIPGARPSALAADDDSAGQSDGRMGPSAWPSGSQQFQSLPGLALAEPLGGQQGRELLVSWP